MGWEGFKASDKKISNLIARVGFKPQINIDSSGNSHKLKPSINIG